MSKHYLQAYAFLAAISLMGVLLVLVTARTPQLATLLVGVAVGLIVPVPLIWLVRKLGYPIGQAVHCARCNAELPVVRRPANFRQAMLGGFTCSQCGADLDRQGRERKAA